MSAILGLDLGKFKGVACTLGSGVTWIFALLAALVYGGPCEAVVGLGIGAVWFPMSLRIGVPDYPTAGLSGRPCLKLHSDGPPPNPPPRGTGLGHWVGGTRRESEGKPRPAA